MKKEKMKTLTIGMTLGVIVVAVALLAFTGLDNSLESEEVNVIPEKIITQPIVQREFTLNMNGNTKHADILTISGTVPQPNSSITGIIYHGGEKSPTIVTVFQLTSDDSGFYTHEVVVNDDYLWKQEGQYIISVQNEGSYKEIKFHRNW